MLGLKLNHVSKRGHCWHSKPMMAQFIDIYIDGLVQDCSISSALGMEILQPCTKPLMYASPVLKK